MLNELEAGWWAVGLSYDLGRHVERVEAKLPGGPVPDAVLARFDARLRVGPAGVSVEGDGPARATLERMVRRAGEGRPLAVPALAGWESDLSQDDFEAAVDAVIDLIEEGQCYQVNLTRRLTTPVPVDPIGLFAALVARHPAPHAALIRVGPVSVVSASPERFLLREGSRVQTRPIKGTAADQGLLVRSAKDRAENVMIVDLARNDLGRVCRFGSVTVPTLCVPESHPGLVHLVSTVEGHLSDGVTTRELISATFPPASVTGAPKPRVLQAIEDLERSRRGMYCGALGFIDGDRRRLDLNVAIRTFSTAGGVTSLGVGAGIVADSQPRAEWNETELKASRLLAVSGAGTERVRTLRDSA